MQDRRQFKFFFFFNDTATTEIYTLSLHDALPIFRAGIDPQVAKLNAAERATRQHALDGLFEKDRKSTRLNSSHSQISYAVFCLKKKNAEAEATHTNPYASATQPFYPPTWMRCITS